MSLICRVAIALCLAILNAAPLRAFDPPDSAGWPSWWGNAMDPAVRAQGSEYLRNPDTRAVGELMLAKHYESVGQLAKALHHASKAAESPSAKPMTASLATYILAGNLGNMGRPEEQSRAIRRYAEMESAALQSGLPLQSSGMMEFYRLAAGGDVKAAKAQLESLGEPKDTASLVEAGFAKANLAAMEKRDPALAYAELEKILPEVARGKTRNMLRLYAAGAVYSDRLFRIDEARSLLLESLNQRSQTDYVLPETDLARLCISSGEWREAAEWLGKAQNAKMTLRPNYRQEAIKHLDLAVADFYLGTGHPGRALASLEKIQDDFLRPGYTTEPIEYFLAGFHLRKFLAGELQFRLLRAAWLQAGIREKFLFAPALAAVAWEQTASRMLFRQNLSTRLAKAPPGVDVLQLFYGPAWLLPAMRAALGDAAFDKICAERMPEGRRLEILAPLLPGGGKLPVHPETPLLTKAAALAEKSRPLSDLASAYQLLPSAPLLSLHPLPISATNLDINPRGWMQPDREGFQLNGQGGEVSLGDGNLVLRTVELPVAPNRGALLEKLGRKLLAVDFEISDQVVKKIEGAAVGFGSENRK